MASLTIRNLEESIKTNLRLQAARHGQSMEEEVRQILRLALSRVKPKGGLGTRIAKRFAVFGELEIELAPRSLPRVAPKFGKRR
ncbi:MAG: plasmid stabilization protein [Betaproteobacteria bacterium]|nr:plasmid stabilization protein [Betaproteobacteria bacterium]